MRNRHSRLIPFAVLVAVSSLVPLLTSNAYYLQVLISMYILIMLSSGLRLMASVEALSVAQAAFFGMGAYTSALLMTKMGWNFWWTFPWRASLRAAPLSWSDCPLCGCGASILSWSPPPSTKRSG